MGTGTTLKRHYTRGWGEAELSTLAHSPAHPLSIPLIPLTFALHPLSHQPSLSSTLSLIHSTTHPPYHSSTLPLIHPITHPPYHSSTLSLVCLQHATRSSPPEAAPPSSVMPRTLAGSYLNVQPAESIRGSGMSKLDDCAQGAYMCCTTKRTVQ